jgi:calcineurin-like phosphoesterase family protein
MDNRFKNYIFCESGFDRSLLHNVNPEGVTLFESFSPNPIADFLAELMAASGRGEIYRYVILTANPEKFSTAFISNNVIGIAGKTAAQIAKDVEWVFSDFGQNVKKSEDDKVFFCSDLHFNHRNIIKYCNRPWNSGKDENGELVVTDDDLARMNDDLVKNFNSVVSPDSVTWFLGDFCMGPKQKEKIPEFRAKLNGKINIVLGNHDHHSVKFYYDAGFDRVYDRSIIIRDFIVLSHAPMEFVKAPFFNCYGHIHDCASYKTWAKDSCCVCVERHGYKPVPLSEIKRRYAELNPE